MAKAKAAPNDMGIEPIGDRVVVRREKAKTVTAGGIALPDKAQPNPRVGTVIAIGPGAWRFIPIQPLLGACPADVARPEDRFPMQCCPGDRVLLPYTAEVLRLDPADEDSEVVVCQENQLLAILHDNITPVEM